MINKFLNNRNQSISSQDSGSDSLKPHKRGSRNKNNYHTFYGDNNISAMQSLGVKYFNFGKYWSNKKVDFIRIKIDI